MSSFTFGCRCEQGDREREVAQRFTVDYMLSTALQPSLQGQLQPTHQELQMGFVGIAAASVLAAQS